MKKILLGLVLVACGFGQVPNLLTNGWLGGSILPSSCQSGVSPDFYNYSTFGLYFCLNNTYVTSPSGSGTVTTINTTGPIAGGTITTSGTISCPTCTTSSPTNHGVAVGGATQALSFTAVGTAGQVLTSNGAGSDPTFQVVTGTGTVTNVATSGPIGGGPITTTGTITCATCLVGTPTNHGVPVGSATQTNNYTATGSAGQVLTSNGASADPTFQTVTGTGTVTSVATTGPITGGTITTTGTIACATCITGTPTNHGVALGSATQANNYTAVGTAGQVLTSNGAGADPTYQTVTGTGTVTVVGAGSLTSTALVTGGGTTTIQTPSATATLSAGGNISTPGSLTTGSGSGVAGSIQLSQGTAPTPGSNVIGWVAPTTVTTSLLLEPPNAVPTANQIMLYPAPTANISQFAWTTFTSTNLTDGATITHTIGSGAQALGTSAITANTCATLITTAAAGVAATDTIAITPNADISGVTGYGVATTDGLNIYFYPTSGNVNFKVCNSTTSSITPGAVTLNWRVTR